MIVFIEGGIYCVLSVFLNINVIQVNVLLGGILVWFNNN